MAEGTQKPRFPLYAQIIAALILGLVLGPVLGKAAGPLGELGRLVVQLIKGVATPLLFFAIVSAVLRAEIAGKGALRMLGAAILNASIALFIGLLISNLIHPGEHLSTVARGAAPGAPNTFADRKIDFLGTLASYIPADFVTPFAQNLILSVILIALLVGFGLRRVREELRAEGNAPDIDGAVGVLLRMCEVVLTWITRLIPLAVFGVVCKSVGEYGYAPLQGLGVYVAVGLLGLGLHVLIVYHAWLYFVLRMPFRRFWREAREPVVYALGANSSLATLPVTLRALDRLGVSRGASALGACVGTNLNNDGIILYEGMALLFVAQASGIHLSLGEQVLAAAVCMFAAMGVAGVPEAGFISLALVLNTLHLPVEILPLLLSVDWIIARARSVTNVLSDMLLSLIVDAGGGADAVGVAAPAGEGAGRAEAPLGPPAT
ncbi:MAG TPA: dicarboxylate/amino acid:cation symporter [Polyangiaceae bacterium]|nr:dicarboxylate/amino acid:cation symporter [Polyangiaceae bacterium]